MKRRVIPINFSTCADAQIRLFRHYGVNEHRILVERYLRLENDWPDQKSFGHSLDNAKQAEYLGPLKAGFHLPQTFEKAVFNMRFGLEQVHGQRLRSESLVLVCGPKPVDEKMPEALWKYAIFFDGKEIGRLGVNFHEDQGGAVAASIANVQGKDGGPFAEYKKEHGRRMQWAFEAITALVQGLAMHVDVVRGISSLSHPSRSAERGPGGKGFDERSTLHLYDHNFSRSELEMIRKTDEAGRIIYERIF